MADIDWRSHLKAKLDAGTTGTIVGATNIRGAGSIDAVPDTRPFVLIRTGTEVPGPFPGVTQQSAVIWVHDEPGDYLLIDSILAAIRTDLQGQVSETGGVSALWRGDSVELADDGYKTITRNSTFQLNGKDQANA